VLTFNEPHVLSVTHYSPLTGQDRRPDNYHTLVYILAPDCDVTQPSLTQARCTDEAQADRFSQNWQQILNS
jgi:hypothetical protein